jgi:hypothetical protein
VATGTEAAHTTHSTAVELIAGFNFALNNNSNGQTITAGQTASYDLDAIPSGQWKHFPEQSKFVLRKLWHARAEYLFVHAQSGICRQRGHERPAERRHNLSQWSNRATYRQARFSSGMAWDSRWLASYWFLVD